VLGLQLEQHLHLVQTQRDSLERALPGPDTTAPVSERAGVMFPHACSWYDPQPVVGFTYPLQQEHLGKRFVGDSYKSRPGLDTTSHPQYRRQQTDVQRTNHESLKLSNPASQSQPRTLSRLLEDPQSEHAGVKHRCA